MRIFVDTHTCITMTPFLQQIANLFYRTYEQNLSDFCFVFPNRRSGIFFERYLMETAEKTFFSPTITTISAFFSSHSTFQLEDKMGLLFRLYKVYQHISKNDESFDSFVSFGEILLRDFDDIDKYLVDAKDIFQNVKDIQSINYLPEYLTLEQKKIIQQFWSNFNPEPKRQQEFLATWEILYPLYQSFKDELQENNLAYEGMLLRELAEKGLQVSYKKVIFIGFNALSKVEKNLFLQLKKQQIADFYWDYPGEYIKDSNNKANTYLSENLLLFPSSLSLEPEHEIKKYVEAIAVPSSVGQAKKVHEILQNLGAESLGTETAIVLSNESLLLPMLYSLPEEIQKVNVTMGYPMLFTPIKELIDNLLALQKGASTNNKDTSYFYYKQVLALLSHRYIYTNEKSNEYEKIIKKIHDNNWIRISSSSLQVDSLLSLIFAPTTSESLCTYLVSIVGHLLAIKKEASTEDTTNTNLLMEQEFLYQCYISLQRMQDLLDKWQVPLTLDTLSKLVKRLLSAIAIPFEGEPLAGLQIMGMLETRCLDFENLIITTFNEGTFPKNEPSPSFIPHNLRKGFDLPTTEHQDAIFAYHFYRLFHRASTVYVLYDTRSEMMNSGERSRFINQLIYGYGVPIVQKTVTYNTSIATAQAISVDKSPAIMAKLENLVLSPSSINSFINCPLQFYFSHIEKIKQSDNATETIESNVFGSIFHYAMEQLFIPFKEKMISKEIIESMIKDRIKLEHLVSEGFSRFYFKDSSVHTLQGNHYLVAQVILKYITKLLHHEIKNTPFLHITHEYKCEESYFINKIGKFAKIKGSIDRVQTKEGNIMLFDYKTGAGDLKYPSIGELFNGNAKDRKKDILQILLYGWLYQQNKKIDTDIQCHILYLRKMFASEFHSQPIHKELGITVFNQDIRTEFLSYLDDCLASLFDETTPFTQTTCLDNCTYCAFKNLCR
jgi:hypothetical protein